MEQHSDPGCTEFAPAPRVDLARILEQQTLFLHFGCSAVLDLLPSLVLALNDCRQIVYANRALLDAVGLADMDLALGKRPGELLNCLYARRAPAGCGTSKFCSQCGAVKSILSGLDGLRSVQECHVLREDGEALDLFVSSAAIDLEGERMVIFSLTDVSHENRRRNLERIFFHDVLNQVGGLTGLAGLLRERLPEDCRLDGEYIHGGLRNLSEEIVAQKELLAAENRELEVQYGFVDSKAMLEIVRNLYARHPVCDGRTLLLAEDTRQVRFRSDARLLHRVLSNLAKNALEAASHGETVTLACEAAPGEVTFRVHNPGCIPSDHQLRIFRRGFTTKGSGRGLGTYSIKLLTERYLEGRVGFVSAPASGTSFTITLPR